MIILWLAAGNSSGMNYTGVGFHGFYQWNSDECLVIWCPHYHLFCFYCLHWMVLSRLCMTICDWVNPSVLFSFLFSMTPDGRGNVHYQYRTIEQFNCWLNNEIHRMSGIGSFLGKEQQKLDREGKLGISGKDTCWQ